MAEAVSLDSVSEGGTALVRSSRRALVGELAERIGSEREARWLVEEAFERAVGVAAGRGPVRAGVDPGVLARQLAERRAAGEPLQHVIGHWSFRRLDVAVDGRALVPRPETEIVVGAALDVLRTRLGAGGTATRPLRIADLGTGSGVIALSIAVELDAPSGAELYATDRSEQALELAAENAARVGALREGVDLVFRRGSWFAALPEELAGTFDLVVSNPPYVSESEWRVLDPVVRDHDPKGALVAGATGLECIEQLIAAAPAWLAPSAALVVEIAPSQGEAVLRLAREAGFSGREVRDDLAGRPRVLVARR